MNSPQRNEKMGRLMEMKQRAFLLSAEIHALQEQIYRATDPTRGLDEVNLQESAALMTQWQAKLAEHRDLCARIQELSDDLGIPMPVTDVRRKR